MKWLAILLVSALGLRAATIAWDASVGATGYKLYYSTTSSNYTQVVDAGNVLTNQIALQPGTYYFAVSAYNVAMESDKSDELKVVIQTNQPSLAINIILESSTSLTGPWSPTNSFWHTNVISGQRFFRARLATQVP